MDNLLEIIGPLIFGIIYVLGKLFAKKGDTEDGSPAGQQEEDPEEADRQRQEQEETLWQIMQQRGHSRQTSQPAQDQTRGEQPIPSSVMPRQEVEKEDSSGFSRGNSDDPYDDEMERQLKKIEASKREATRLQSNSAQGGVKSVGEIGSSLKRRKRSSFDSVRSSLKDPAAARSAFIYGEVLGPPVSQRKTTGVPGLSS